MSEKIAKQLIEKAYKDKADFLDLGRLGLAEIPESIVKLAPYLKGLNLGTHYLTGNAYKRSRNGSEENNFFTSFYSSFDLLSEFTELTSLHLSETLVHEYAFDGLKIFNQISVLTISGNGIYDSGAASIAKLPNLVQLDISRNKITDIGAASIASISGLKYLDLNSNKIKETGVLALTYLKKLTHLFLHDNNIKDVGIAPISSLSDLTQLDVSSNEITDKGAASISSLNNLVRLDIGNNKITDKGAVAIAKMTNLRYLDIRRNQITDEGATAIASLTNLAHLDMGYNEITDAGSEVLSGMSSLTTIGLSYNQLTSLQPFLSLLERGFIVNNEGKVSMWPNEIAVIGNPLKTPPTEVISQGDDAILRYLQKLQNEGEQQVFEAKLVLTGSGESGKTSLSRRLNDKKALLPDKDDRTRDVEVSDYCFKTFKGNDFTAHIWDFGGQQIIHNFHRLFMNDSALYILLTETSRENDDFDYWLQTIRLFGGESPILFVQNKRKGIPRRLDIAAYKAHFNIQNDLYEVNLLSNEGLDALEQAIQYIMPQLPVVQRTVPKSWHRLREELHNIKEAFISYERFVGICRLCGINERVDIEDAGGFLHLLGIILWYKNNSVLKEKIILERDWATKALFKLIFDQQINEQQKGYFNLADAQKVWDNEAGYCHHASQLVALMLEFKLAYRQKNKTDAYIIPALLPAQAPNKSFYGNPRLKVCWQYKHLPRGIVNQLTAELHRLIEKDEHTWSEGVWLRFDVTEAKVVEIKTTKTIEAEVSGVQYRELFGTIQHTLDQIHSEYKGIDVKMKIPCVCNSCRCGSTSHFFDYSTIINRLDARKKTTIECVESGEDVFLKSLLDNFKDPHKGDRVIGPKRIFISYSHHDEQYKKELDAHFANLKRGGVVDTWHDRKLIAGDAWDNKVKLALLDSDIVLLLLSPDFMASDYIWDIEIRTAIETGKTVVPIFLRPCDFKDSVFGINEMQGLPNDVKWIVSNHWLNRDEAYLEVVKGVKSILSSIESHQPFKRMLSI